MTTDRKECHRPSACPYDPHCGAWNLRTNECGGDPAECEVREVRGGMVCASICVVAVVAVFVALAVLAIKWVGP